MKVDIKQYFNQTYQKITISESRSEKEAILFWVFENKFGVSRATLLSEKTVEVDFDIIDKIILRINKNEPIQYILGESLFLGRVFIVDSSVLIPRPETEWMTDEIISQFKNYPDMSLLDIGTGSGCIAISLQLELKNPKVYATDCSETALNVAKKNAVHNRASIHFYKSDILNDEIIAPHLDLIVSNPPYILSREKKMIRENVLNYEPSLALFVPDNDPLIYYHEIASKSIQSLKPLGYLFTEINELYGEEIVLIFEQYGFSQVEIVKDLYGKNRMVSGMKKE